MAHVLYTTFFSLYRRHTYLALINAFFCLFFWQKTILQLNPFWMSCLISPIQPGLVFQGVVTEIIVSQMYFAILIPPESARSVFFSHYLSKNSRANYLLLFWQTQRASEKSNPVWMRMSVIAKVVFCPLALEILSHMTNRQSKFLQDLHAGHTRVLMCLRAAMRVISNNSVITNGSWCVSVWQI